MDIKHGIWFDKYLLPKTNTSEFIEKIINWFLEKVECYRIIEENLSFYNSVTLNNCFIYWVAEAVVCLGGVEV